MRIIAHIETEFPTKFGVPRQSGLVPELGGRVVFEKEYRNPDAVRGLDGFSHIWLLWQFQGVERQRWSATVRPPRLGGNQRMGVFATRSPFRPNPIGLSSVVLDRVELDPELGPVLYVSGVDLMDGTLIYDIKPYLAFTDSHPDATGGFAQPLMQRRLEVVFPEPLLSLVPERARAALIEVLAGDPRPSYQGDGRVYGVPFGAQDIRFTVDGGTLTVLEVAPYP